MDMERNEKLFDRLDIKDFAMNDGDLSGDEMFVFYAYYEKRDPAGPRIHFLVNVNCRTFNKADILVDVGAGKLLTLEFEINSNTIGCGNCLLQGINLATVVYDGPIPDEITIHRKTNSWRVKLHKNHENYNERDELKSCIIAPLFWYTDWPRLFINFEWWKRKIGVKKILMHIHSMSRETKHLIDFYVKEGLLEIRAFPWMPFTANFNPNDHVFYASEYITTMLCGVWSDSKYTTMNDVDELFYVRDPSDDLLKMTRRKMGKSDDSTSNKTVGSIKLKTRSLTFPTGMKINQGWTYKEFKKLDFLKSTVVYATAQCPKYVYETEGAKKPWIHEMKQFWGDRKQITLPIEVAINLHMKNEYVTKPLNDTSGQILENLRLFEDEELEEMREMLGKIFGERVPIYTMNITKPVLSECRLRSRRDTPGEECLKTTGTTCYEMLKDLDEWFYAVPNGENRFTVI